ncbi:DUF2238 domain-containing protein [Paenibacillus sp. GCM10027628]|uniref:DUF2238 domain-containing protein n=1 Tax=Paenibacillus sp. GCM10027628 TaxID=3273413 RepID=UPI003625A7FB
MNIPFKQNKWLQLLVVVLAIFWVVLAIRPTNRTQWFLENLLLIAALLTLALTYKKFSFSNLSYTLIFIFLCLHAYAAHYAYQNTPFDVWLKASFHTQRSYFDRVVHFAFGLCWTYPFRELYVCISTQRKLWTYVIPAAVVFSCSAFFEILEVAVAYAASLIGRAGQVGEDYLGLQGDIYDSQKDMGLGLLGAIVAMGITAGIIRAKEK